MKSLIFLFVLTFSLNAFGARIDEEYIECEAKFLETNILNSKINAFEKKIDKMRKEVQSYENSIFHGVRLTFNRAFPNSSRYTPYRVLLDNLYYKRTQLKVYKQVQQDRYDGWGQYEDEWCDIHKLNKKIISGQM